MALASTIVNCTLAFALDEITTGPPPPAPLTVNTDKVVYVANETITISGKVEITGTEKPKLVQIQIFNPKDVMITSNQVPIAQDGTYNLKVDGDFRITGEYRIVVFLPNGYNTNRSFMFIAGPYTLIVHGEAYPIKYRITSGTLDKIEAVIEEKSLTLQITNTTASGQFTIELPRNVINAVKDSTDSDFIVFIDGKQADFKELRSTESTRTLAINFTYDGATNPYGILDIKIVGTKLVPEFPITLIMTITTVGSIVSVLASRALNKIRHQSSC